MSEKEPAVVQLVFFIVDWAKIKQISSIFNQAHVRFHFIVKGEGTANSEMLDMLGIGKCDKAVILCLEQKQMIPALLNEVREQMGLHIPGAGIGFSVPLSGISALILKTFKISVEKSIAALSMRHSGEEGEQIMDEVTVNQSKKYDLIMAILNQGYSEEFMGIARTAGAGGGTVINARGIMHQGPVKFFGISVQEEKEIIIILAKREKMRTIMEAVSKTFGMGTEAEAVVFSLPAENITGIDLH